MTYQVKILKTTAAFFILFALFGLLSACDTGILNDESMVENIDKTGDAWNPATYEYVGVAHNQILDLTLGNIEDKIIRSQIEFIDVTRSDLIAVSLYSGSQLEVSEYLRTDIEDAVYEWYKDIFDIFWKRPFDPCNPNGPIGPGPTFPCDGDINAFYSANDIDGILREFLNEVFQLFSDEALTYEAFIDNKRVVDEALTDIEMQAIEALDSEEDIVVLLNTTATARSSFTYWATQYQYSVGEISDGESNAVTPYSFLGDLWDSFKDFVGDDAKGAAGGAIGGCAAGSLAGGPGCLAGGGAGAIATGAGKSVVGAIDRIFE